jgi:hypothetical protein
VSRFSEAIEAARLSSPPRNQTVDTLHLDAGPEVQLSVRMPENLRAAVASTAAARRTTVTAFVAGALRRAVVEANDSFGGLRDELSRHAIAEIRSVVDDGTYRSISAEVEREEVWS